MTTHIHSYSLQAFPTEKILKEFKPVRGFVARGAIELPPGQEELLHTSLDNRETDRLAWQKPTVEVELGPLFEAIAERMGYDPALLAEGRGETGRPDHAWSVYADESGFPLLIRWQAGTGELLLSIGIFGQQSLTIAMLADQNGLETMLKVHDIVTGIEATKGRTERVSVPVGDTLQVVEVGCSDDWGYFGPMVTICLPPDRQLNDIRRKELQQTIGIHVSIGAEEEVNHRHQAIMGIPRLTPNSLRVEMVSLGLSPLDFGPEEPLSQSLLRLINEANVRRTWSAFEMLADSNASFDHSGWVKLHEKEQLDVELSERRLKLEELERKLLPHGDRFGPARLSLSREFRTTPATELRGTGPMAKMVGGDVGTSGDLIEMLERVIWDLRRLPQLPPAPEAKPRLKIKGTCQFPPLAGQYADTAREGKRFEDLPKPYPSTHRGLPVRVDKRVLVWRSNDTEALAADYFRHPGTGDVHMANLYRVKVPKE